MSGLNKQFINHFLHRIGYLTIIILALSFTSTLAFAEANPAPRLQSNEYILDQCYGVVHFPDWGDYPDIDTSDPLFNGALSLGILGFTYDLSMVPYGSLMTVDFADGWSYTGMVGEDGKTFIYRGLWDYGNYGWADVVVDPSGNEINTGLNGTLVVDASEVQCDSSTLISSPLPAAEPTPTPTTPPEPTPTPTSPPPATQTAEAEPELISEPDTVAISEEDGEGGFIDRFMAGAVSWVYYCLVGLCCIVLLVLGFSVIIIIRRRRGQVESVDVIIK
ncbi:MAG: hypothetical protein FVQ83_11675 [Chloroflexi bacterium]|nr:hypothetical protein [Chloroflexota bacterium]